MRLSMVVTLSPAACLLLLGLLLAVHVVVPGGLDCGTAWMPLELRRLLLDLVRGRRPRAPGAGC